MLKSPDIKNHTGTIETKLSKIPFEPGKIGRLRFGLATLLTLGILLVSTTCISKSTVSEIAQLQAPNFSILRTLDNPTALVPLEPPPAPALSRTGVSSSESFITGVNMVDAIYWTDTDIELGLKEVKKMKGTLIRTFIANNQVSDEETAKRLNIFLDRALSYNISVIPVLIDYHGGPWDRKSMAEAYINAACPKENPAQDLAQETVKMCSNRIRTWKEVEREILAAGYGRGFNPEGTNNFYIKDGEYGVLSNEFFAEGYKGRYKEFVGKITRSTMSYPNVFAIEIGNELRAKSQTFISFMKDMTATIRSIDPSRRIATGMSDSKLTGLMPEQFYPSIDVDVITVHSYDGDRAAVPDALWATKAGKILLVEETGFSGPGDRSGKLKDELDIWKKLGAIGVLAWDFDPRNPPSGKGSNKGLNIKNSDYWKMIEVLAYSSN